MSKPDLRAGLEADLKLVCEGRKTKEEVIKYLLGVLKDILVRV